MPSIATDRLTGISTSRAIKAPCVTVATTAITLSGEQTVNGVACVTGDRVLRAVAGAQVDNGIWVVDTGAWARAKDFDSSRDVTKGTMVLVAPATNDAVTYVVATSGVITPGTTAIAIQEFSGDAISLQSDLASAAGDPLGAYMIGWDGTTVGDDLDTARPVTRGGTGATTVAGALTNLGLINLATEVSVTGATTLTSTAINKSVVLSDSGSPANYSVSLPAGAASGSVLMVRIASGATKLYTINGNDVTIDGQATRVMWAGESALLLREGSQWTKITGKSRAFCGFLRRATSQSITPGATWVPLDFSANAGDFSFLDLSFDSANGRFAAPRRSNWVLQANVSIAATCSVAGEAQFAFAVNGSAAPTITPNGILTKAYLTTDTRATFSLGLQSTLNQSSYIEVIGRLSSGTYSASAYEVGATIEPTLSYLEVPTW